MGMFDYVMDNGKPLEMDCPRCGSLATGFQSKSGPLQLTEIDWRELEFFYAPCEHCGQWIECERGEVGPIVTSNVLPKDYEDRTIRKVD